MNRERHYSDLTLYRRILREARPYWLHIGGIFLINLLSTPLTLLSPLPLKIAVDSVLGDDPLPSLAADIVPNWIQDSTTSLLFLAVLLLVAIELLKRLQSLAKTLLKTYTGERLTLHFRSVLFRHAQNLSLNYHDRNGTADAIYRIQNDASSIQSVAIEGVIPFVVSGITFVGMLVVISMIEPTLAMIAVIAAPMLGGLTWYYRKTLRARHRHVKTLESGALAVIQEVLTSIRVVKAFGQERREERRFEDKTSAGMRARLRLVIVDGSFWVAISLVTAVGTGLVLYFGIKSVIAGSITLGSLLVVLDYLMELYAPLYTVSRQVASLQSGFASAERAFTLLDEAPDVPEPQEPMPLSRAMGEIEFRDVTFGYDGSPPIMHKVSFHVSAGSRVGISGRTGAGKTTLVNLLTRFYDPSDGQVVLDGVDVRDYRVRDLRNQFAIVLQEPVLFSTTIGENISYGRPEATIEEIIAAARAAEIHDFISSLPDGYDTAVGERGMTLSGGERQRISLARAFLKDAPILILDEPTSSVDVKTEAGIIEAMERLMHGRTTFIIAHRLETLKDCSARLKVQAGSVTLEERDSQGNEDHCAQSLEQSEAESN
jgi:ATP-binding cassette, subfamily B, bacterial